MAIKYAYFNGKRYRNSENGPYKRKQVAHRKAMQLRRKGKYFARVQKGLGGYHIFTRKRDKRYW